MVTDELPPAPIYVRHAAPADTPKEHDYWMNFRRHLISELREVEERILGLPVEKRALRRAARQ